MEKNSQKDYGFTREILSSNLHDEYTLSSFENETSIQRKIKYILENIEDKDVTLKDRLEKIKEELNIYDETAIKEIMGEFYRKKYFGGLKIESIKEKNKKRTIHVLERSPEDQEEIEKSRKEKNEAKHKRKQRGKRKGVQTTIKFPKDKE